jgi:hypothetical protein
MNKICYNHYKQLLGHKIMRFYFDDTCKDIEPFPILITECEGKQYQVVVCQDAEGNGGGFLDINLIPMEEKNASN